MNHQLRRTKLISFASWFIVAALLALSVALGLNQAAVPQLGPLSTPDDVNILTRGPMLEAFVGNLNGESKNKPRQ